MKYSVLFVHQNVCDRPLLEFVTIIIEHLRGHNKKTRLEIVFFDTVIKITRNSVTATKVKCIECAELISLRTEEDI